MPPREEKDDAKAPSILHLTHKGMGEFHKTSLMLRGFEGWIEMLNFLRMEKSLMEEEANCLVLFSIMPI